MGIEDVITFLKKQQTDTDLLQAKIGREKAELQKIIGDLENELTN